MNMPQLRYDEDLVEAAAFLCASGKRPGVPALQIRRFERERDRLYSILDPDDRNAAFFRLHLEWFREWGLENLLTSVVSEFALLPGALTALAFRKARNKKEEGAEMYVNAAERTGVVALRPECFGKDDALARFLRHELAHVEDMVDPAFGYEPDLYLPGQTAAQQRLTRERYRLLWNISVDGRLIQSGRGTIATREQRQADFHRAYSFWSDEKREAAFIALWTNAAPTHRELLALASDPRDLAAVQAPLPGSTCPLCGFPTFSWANLDELPPVSLGSIRAQFPAWTLEQGACARCAEVYEAISKHELPATVML
jgi:hypothetical protein